VTKSGGRIVICEFSAPVWRPFRTIYTNYLMRALPFIARKTSSNPDAYPYGFVNLPSHELKIQFYHHYS
jgi:demethylmenaquinone methyltransferase/2-methoxy-6-polyprenyl-1,4-benzoquinol methylase